MLFITGILKTPRSRKGETKRTGKDIPRIIEFKAKKVSLLEIKKGNFINDKRLVH